MNTSISLSPGTYNTVVEEWDYCGGASYTKIDSVVVKGGTSTGVSVSSPSTGASASSPVRFVATGTTGCSKGVASMGVYVNNSLKYTVGGASLNTSIALSSGTYNTVVEEWDYCGGASYTQINNVVVTGSTAAASSSIPSYAKISSALDGWSSWQWEHDAGTPGTSSASSYYAVSSPSTDGKSRELSVSYYNHGGERYHTTVTNDPSVTHFVYDTRVYVVNPSQIANIELDINQVMSNGRTVIFGSQCSSYSGTWEYVKVSNGSPHWNRSNIPCNPKSWSAYAWHHIQVASHRDQYGNVFYDWVNLDGKMSYFSNASGYDSLGLGWTPGSITMNIQLDGASSSNGSMKMYMDGTNIYRW